MFELGCICDEGLEVERDYSEAMKWYKKATELWNSDAMFNLGYMCGKGLGIERNIE